MKSFFSLFSDSAKELKKPKCLAVTAMLLAVNMLLKSVSITFTSQLKIGVAFIANALTGMLFGPVVGGLAAGAGDILGMMVDKTGAAFNPMFTLIAIISGATYGVFLYKKDNTKSMLIGIIVSKLAVTVIANLILTPITLAFMYTKGTFWEYFKVNYYSRLIKNIAMYPFNVLLMVLTMPILYSIYYRKKLNQNSLLYNKITSKFSSDANTAKADEAIIEDNSIEEVQDLVDCGE